MKIQLNFVGLAVTILLFCKTAIGQLPTCPNNHLVYFATAGTISNFDPGLPVSASNPTINSILMNGGNGLAVSPNLNASTPPVTFYTVAGSYYKYHNGSSWVYTGHYAGPGVNIGAGGGYIYNYDVSDGTIWRYDGTGNAILLMNLGMQQIVADIAADCAGNFYVLTNSTPQSLKKYNPDGQLIKTYSLVGAPVANGGAGLSIYGNNVYYNDINNFMHGTFAGNTVVFTVSPAPSVIFDLASCAGSPTPNEVFQVICGNELPYSWNGNIFTTPGTYTVTLPGSNGCDSMVTLNLSVGNSTTGIPENVTICNAQLPYSWNGTNYTAAGTYSIVLVSSGGCDSLATLNLNVGTITGPPENTAICNADLPYLWNGTQYSSTGSYTTVLSGSNGCDSTATLNLNVILPVSTRIDTSVCLEQLPYQWNGQHFNNPGIYTLLFTGMNGCDSLVTVNLSLYPQVNAFAGNDDTILVNIPYHLSGSGGTIYEWSPASQLNNPNIPNPTAVITNSTTFSLVVKDSNNCIGKASVNVKVLTHPSIFVPTAFSPNKDDINNVFRPTYTDISTLNYFKVFNRYGQLMFQTTDLSGGWNGTCNGLPQNIGGYVWALEAIDNKGKIWKEQGSVVLIR